MQETGFPFYARAEALADHIVHLVGVSAAVASTTWLLATSCIRTATTSKLTLTLLVYSVGLIGMFAVSAAYHLARPGLAKAVLRRVDHATIFVMIAGSYTPFAVNALAPPLGTLLCGAVWTLAAAGIGLKLASHHPFQRVSVALYLGMGWLLLPVIRPVARALPGDMLLLLLAGGGVYTLGTFVHARTRMPFHNAVWHAMVLIGASLHFLAVAGLVSGPG